MEITKRGQNSRRMSQPTTPIKTQKKKRFRETSKEELSWLVYSSYGNHELLRCIFGVFYHCAGEPDFTDPYEQSQGELLGIVPQYTYTEE